MELEIVDRASDSTIGRVLKNVLKPHTRKCWAIPPEANAAFVAGMEEVLEVYRRPHDPKRPLVCLDETSKQLISETRAPIPMKPGSPARYDYEYERNGVANLFTMFAPLEGWRRVKVTDRHTAIEYAQVLKEIGRSLRRRRADHARAEQSEHPRQVLALQGLPSARGSTPRPAI